MAFVALANTGLASFRAERPTRKDAAETALGLLGQGLSKVVIIHEDGEGRTYTPSEFEKIGSPPDRAAIVGSGPAALVRHTPGARPLDEMPPPAGQIWERAWLPEERARQPR
jgi:hypothetical protein